ncbi:DUF6970 domain-containing protein [Adhaeribacter rhizoryzae]|uniref:DUF6970 domain-containing protein n=1 Tax=Adhaeribacter rhizoryzae TaxID=2607907 RepID=UPI00167FE25D|nr:hypothetical protein [Adhaeribacter rhizoryzae]
MKKPFFIFYSWRCLLPVKIICHPNGGILGRGGGKCEDFFTTRQHEKLNWEDKR